MAKKILVVDDSKTMRDMVSFTLKGAAYDVLEAEDGKKAIEKLGAAKVDCIITDLNMPVMDGLQLIRALRAEGANRMTPILMLTTEGDPTKKDAGRQAGATGWLVKPFNGPKLLQTVAKVCA
jgi:two-component system chemotaxis response regulator CheY